MLKGCASLSGIIFSKKLIRVTFSLLFCFSSSMILIMYLLIHPYFFHRFLSSFTFSSTHYQMRSVPIFFSIYGTHRSFTLKQQILTVNYEGCRVLYARITRRDRTAASLEPGCGHRKTWTQVFGDM